MYFYPSRNKKMDEIWRRRAGSSLGPRYSNGFYDSSNKLQVGAVVPYPWDMESQRINE